MKHIKNGTAALALFCLSVFFVVSVPVWAPNNDAVWHHILWVGIGVSYLFGTIGTIQLTRRDRA